MRFIVIFKKILCTTVALCSLAIGGQAFAHAHLKSAAPAADATVAAPAEVNIVFSEGLEQAFSSIVVSDSTDHAVTANKVEVDGASHTTMRLVLPALAAGIYQVKWIAVARDGHRSNGSYRFTVK